jgi:hypothetical protein
MESQVIVVQLAGAAGGGAGGMTGGNGGAGCSVLGHTLYQVSALDVSG